MRLFSKKFIIRLSLKFREKGEPRSSQSVIVPPDCLDDACFDNCVEGCPKVEQQEYFALDAASVNVQFQDVPQVVVIVITNLAWDIWIQYLVFAQQRLPNNLRKKIPAALKIVNRSILC